jgi:hypothetical protein
VRYKANYRYDTKLTEEDRKNNETWVGLTDEELRQCIGIGTENSDWNVGVVQEWLRKVEAKLKEKNNG